MGMSSWSKKLSRPVKVTDGRILETLNDARSYVLKDLPKGHANRNEWQHAVKLMLEAADGADPQDATLQIEFALLMSNKLWLPPPKKPARSKS